MNNLLFIILINTIISYFFNIKILFIFVKFWNQFKFKYNFDFLKIDIYILLICWYRNIFQCFNFYLIIYNLKSIVYYKNLKQSIFKIKNIWICYY